MYIATAQKIVILAFVWSDAYLNYACSRRASKDFSYLIHMYLWKIFIGQSLIGELSSLNKRPFHRIISKGLRTLQPSKGLHWCYVGVTLVLHWRCMGPALALHWRCISTVCHFNQHSVEIDAEIYCTQLRSFMTKKSMGLFYPCNDLQCLALHWCCIGASLVLHCRCIWPCIGPVLALHWRCIGAVLSLQNLPKSFCSSFSCSNSHFISYNELPCFDSSSILNSFEPSKFKVGSFQNRRCMCLFFRV